ncbi:Panacea domain-containing protein [Candidatus Magnetominusculus xianensis]|uniref:Phage-associated protein n=1 Tax=Candidatus Magnetominusculus xianensis TaxID=1748249 RepID=A0ABR5SAR6_9BACT|nr:type II toxin-antitoxin system antitoxin SocA domain-containing protein [Candidatus Magnetominusculus xianensis]KWT74722.1 putative phage-associated protein [Candidatus Magnetominusculus xianensis]MBF0404713.1 SocA family protein [Nitrospirota bacterium]
MDTTEEHGVYTCFDIADYFLFKAAKEDDDEEEALLSNLKLQKLVYYAQGLYLNIFRRPLFNESIQAWTYGPVIPELYQKYKNYGKKSIPAPEGFNPDSVLSSEVREFLDEIYDVFGQFTAIRLKDMTHEDECWKQSFNKSPRTVITHEAMLKALIKHVRM